MTSLLEFREKLKLIYSKNEVFIIPIIKFLLAFTALMLVNGQLGYMNKLDKVPVVLIVALFCSFLPNGCIILFAAAFSLLHLYALSMEVALVGFCVYLVMFLLFFRFSPRDSLVVLITPMLFVLKIPYVMPVAMGLVGGPAAAFSVGCGVVVYYFLRNVSEGATAISTMGAEEATAKLRMVIDGLLNNKEMLVVAAAFAVTVIVVYLIRRMSIDHSWTIAMIAGVIIDLVILLVGDLLYDTNMSVLNAVLGSAAALAVAKLLEFFRFCVDYSRTEKVQFEDDEYYYYVKAIPKMTVAAQTKTVKKINTQRRPPVQGQRAGGSQSPVRNTGSSTERSHSEGAGKQRTGNGAGAQRITEGAGMRRTESSLGSQTSTGPAGTQRTSDSTGTRRMSGGMESQRMSGGGRRMADSAGTYRSSGGMESQRTAGSAGTYRTTGGAETQRMGGTGNRRTAGGLGTQSATGTGYRGGVTTGKSLEDEI